MKSLSELVGGLRQFIPSWTVSSRDKPSGAKDTTAVRIFCFGNSNAVCLVQAWKRRQFRPSDPAFDFRFLLYGPKQFPGDALVSRASDGSDRIYDRLAASFEESGALSGATEAWMVSVVRGNSHNIIGLFEPVPLFDFVNPAHPEESVREDGQIVPYDVVRAMFEQAAEPLDRFYGCLPRQNIAGVLHLEAPPPIPSEKQCRSSLEGILLRKQIGVPKTARISPREFRIKLWRCQVEVNRAICARHGVIHVMPPEDTLDSEGFLLPEAWWGATHANSWYGARALGKIQSVIEAQRRKG